MIKFVTDQTWRHKAIRPTENSTFFLLTVSLHQIK